MNIVARLTLEALSELKTEQLPNYEAALKDACESCPPPFGMAEYGDLFRESASDPAWFAGSLVANSLAEGDGSRRLWDLSRKTANRRISDFVKIHSIDEARHAHWYMAITNLVFPNSIDPKLHESAQDLIPRFGASSTDPARERSPFAHDVTLDDLIQMNIAEIRTRIHHMLQRPLLVEFCQPSNRPMLVALLDRLLLDETKHIQYTARLIEEFTRQRKGGDVRCLMRDRMLDFNRLTEDEMNKKEFPSCANCDKCFIGR